MTGFEITYDRDVNRTASAPPPYQPPATIPPIVRGTPVPIVIERRKGTKANPSGSVKSVAWLWPSALTHAVAEPPGANALIKVLASEPAQIIASYAYGYDINAKGENVRKPIWETRQRGPADGTPKPRKDGKPPSSIIRTQVGEEEPQPSDSIVLAGVWRNGSGRVIAYVEGWWLDTKPQRFRVWTLGGAAETISGSSDFMARVKEVADDLRRGERLL